MIPGETPGIAVLNGKSDTGRRRIAVGGSDCAGIAPGIEKSAQIVLTQTVKYVKLLVTKQCNFDRGAALQEYRCREAFAGLRQLGKGTPPKDAEAKGVLVEWDNTCPTVASAECYHHSASISDPFLLRYIVVF